MTEAIEDRLRSMINDKVSKTEISISEDSEESSSSEKWEKLE